MLLVSISQHVALSDNPIEVKSKRNFTKPTTLTNTILITNIAQCGINIPNQKMGYVINPNTTEIADSLVDFLSINMKKKW